MSAEKVVVSITKHFETLTDPRIAHAVARVARHSRDRVVRHDLRVRFLGGSAAVWQAVRIKTST